MPESRLFTAVTFDDETKRALRQAACRLEQAGVRANFTRQDNLHLTLVFLGETENQFGARQALDRVRARPFTLTLAGLGTFARRGGDVLWAGVRPCPALEEAQRQLAAALRAEGFSAEDRPYRPHVTLARRARLPAGFSLAGNTSAVPALCVQVEGFSLMESCRVEGQLVYRPLYTKLFEQQTGRAPRGFTR